MALETVLEKIQLKDEKNILVQGLPSSIEKQFIKTAFAKSVTPLLKSRKIDFALVFSITKNQLCNILNEVIPAMQDDAKLWIAYPKVSAKITSDLCRDCNWDMVTGLGFESVRMVALDNTWTAIRFKKPLPEKTNKKSYSSLKPAKGVDYKKRSISIPEELKTVFRKHKNAGVFFDSLSFTNKREYVEYVVEAKRIDTRTKRLESVLEKLNTGKKNPTAK